MDMIGFWVVFVFFTIVSLLLILVKRKTIEIIGLHLIIMLSCIVIGATMMFPLDSTFAVIFMLINIVAFIGNILMLEA